MLTWSPGSKKYDGIWGAHWYNEINKTIGFSKRTKPYNTNHENMIMSKKDRIIILGKIVSLKIEKNDTVLEDNLHSYGIK